MNNRVSYIDIARAIAMILIVFGHTIIRGANMFGIYTYIYSFHVVLFFVISGFTYSDNKRLVEFVKSRFCKIMIPYFIFALLFLVPYLMFGNLVVENLSMDYELDALKSFAEIFYGVGYNIALKQNTALWFLPALFTTEVIYRGLDKIKLKYKNIMMLLGLLILSFLSTLIEIVLPWGINSALTMMFFYHVGRLIKEYKVLDYIKSNCINLTLSALLLVAISVLFGKNITVSCVDYRYGNYLIFLTTSILGSVSILLISKSINKSKILEYVGKNTISILLFHKLFVLLFQSQIPLTSSLISNSNILIVSVTSVGITVVSIIISLAIGWVIEKYFPFMYGNFKMNWRKNEKKTILSDNKNY